VKQLRISPDLALPLDAITETFGILAVKRAGKSNAGVVMAEEMFKAGLPWIAIDPKGDWWGMRSSADGNGPGLPIVVFGGLHADVPLEPSAGQMVADIVVDQRLTCVIDVSEMTKADMRRFLTAFIRRLYQRNREPLHVFAEEADEYIPQMVRGDDAEMVGVWETLVKRGGFRGLGCTLITQRSASLNNDVLTQIQTLFALRTTGVPDRKRIEEWVNYHQAGKEFVQQLPTLADGEALLFSPNFLRTVKKIRFRRRETFDSGATPKVGVKARPPVTLADVDLDVLRQKMAATIEKAKADDPRELKKLLGERDRKIAELERRISIPPRKEIREVEKIVERLVPVPVDEELIRALIGRSLAIRNEAEMINDLAQSIRTKSDNKAAQLKRQVAQSPSSLLRGDAGAEGLTPPSRTPAAWSAKARPVPSAAANGNPSKDAHFMHSDLTFKLGRGERKVLAVLAQWPEGRAQKDVAFLAGYSAKASTLGVILSKLRAAALVEPGQPVKATELGLAAAGGVQELPSGPELLAHWMRHPRIGEGERKVLRALIDAYPEALTHAELCERTNYSPDASTMGVILSKLRKLGLVEAGARRVPDAFMEAIA